MNLEEGINSFREKDNSKFIEFPYNFELLKDDEINKKYLNFLRIEKSSTNQNKNIISSPSEINQQKKFKLLRKKR